MCIVSISSCFRYRARKLYSRANLLKISAIFPIKTEKCANFVPVPDSLALNLAPVEKEIAAGLFLAEAEISQFTGRADRTVEAYGSLHNRKIAFHFPDMSANLYRGVASGGDWLAVFYHKGCGHSCNLEFPVDNPFSEFVHQCGLNTAVQGIEPALIIVSWIPETYYIIAVLVEFHFQTERIGRTAAETIVAFLFKAYIWIKDSFHLVAPCGIEPQPSEPESEILSIKL